MSMSRLADLLRVGTRESGRRGCTSALVVGLPEPWVPLRHTITSPDATFNGQSTEEHQDPHRPQLDELCIDIWMTESLTTSCGLSPQEAARHSDTAE